MNNRCFSSSQLYALRNQINVQMLIEKTLRIPSRATQGCFRFLCPLCNAFDTAVNPKTNLARCFRCEKNFNTIDIVMLNRQADFVGSVRFLQSILQKDELCHDRGAPVTISASNHKGGCRMKLKTPLAKSDSRPSPIEKILDSILPQKHADISEKSFAESKPDQIPVAHHNIDENRIVMLEQQLEYLSHQIEKIARTLNVRLSSK